MQKHYLDRGKHTILLFLGERGILPFANLFTQGTDCFESVFDRSSFNKRPIIGKSAEMHGREAQDSIEKPNLLLREGKNICSVWTVLFVSNLCNLMRGHKAIIYSALAEKVRTIRETYNDEEAPWSEQTPEEI
jgi:hypothetical protein